MRLISFDRWGTQLGEITGITSATWTEELGGTDKVEIVCDSPMKKGDRIVWRDQAGEWHEHIITTAERIHDDRGIRYKATGENSVIELYWDYIDALLSGLAIEALMTALAPTRWDIGNVDSTSVSSAECYRISCREALAQIVEKWGVELMTRIEVSGCNVTRRVIGLGRRGADKGCRFEWGHSLKDIKRTYSADDVVSALYGYGKVSKPEDGGKPTALDFASINDGLPFVFDDAVRDAWGRPDRNGGKAHVFGIVEFTDCEDQADLLARTHEAFETAKAPRVSYEASVASFESTGFPASLMDLGDIVSIIDSEFSDSIRFRGRISKVVRDLAKGGEVTDITLGTIVESAVDIFAKQSTEIRSLNRRSGSWDAAASTLSGDITSGQNSWSMPTDEVRFGRGVIADAAGGTWNLTAGTASFRCGSDTNARMDINANGIAVKGQQGITCDMRPIARAKFVDGICVGIE